jgi:hypothetical protein
VTIGINRTTWREVLERQMNRLLADPAFDQPLPAGYHRDPAGFTAMLASHVDRVRGLMDNADVGVFAVSELDRFATSRASALRGGLVDRLLIPSLRAASRWRKAAGAPRRSRDARSKLAGRTARSGPQSRPPPTQRPCRMA